MNSPMTAEEALLEIAKHAREYGESLGKCIVWAAKNSHAFQPDAVEELVAAADRLREASSRIERAVSLEKN